MSYFEQTKSGESRWWSWIAVTWLAFVGWMVFQLILTMPIVGIAAMTDPPLDQALNSAFASSTGSASSQALSLISALCGLGVTLAVIVILLTEGMIRKIAGALAGVGILLCFATSKLASQGSDSSEIMNVITQVMGASPLAFTLFLLTFPAGLIALYLAYTNIHKRNLLTLHTAASKFRWVRVLQGFVLAWIVLGAFSFIANMLGIIEVQYIFAGGKFWIFALVSLLFIPLQSATEEIVFRGYFNQGLIHMFKSKWIAFAITSFAFMALHLSNPEALEGAASGSLPIVMSGYFFFGFAMCLIVWIDDGLETAIGIHAGNNCFAAIIMNYENSVLPTPSVFLTGTDPVKDSISTVLVLATMVAIIWYWRNGSKRRAL